MISYSVIKLSYLHFLSHCLYHGAKIIFKTLFIFDDAIGLEFGKFIGIYVKSPSELPPLSFPSSDNTWLEQININIGC